MTSVKEYYAAMAETLIDEELSWRLHRLPVPEKRTKLDKALIKEAMQRGLVEPDVRS